MRLTWREVHFGIVLIFYCFFTPCTRTDRVVYELQKGQTNIALRRPVLTSGGNSPTEANDGDSKSKWPCVNVNVCNGSLGCWWQVDFGDVKTVDTVLVTNRGDCCPGRIADFSLDVYDTDPAVDPSGQPKHCASYPGPMSSPGVTETIHCEVSLQGRFLRISQPTNKLQFCELQAFGTPTYRVEPCGSFQASPSSRYPALNIDKAGQDVTSRAACAAECSKNTSCAGFNIKYSPNVLCELILEAITWSPIASSEFDFYQMDHCWHICE